MLHVDGAERLLRIYLPAALPSIMAGLRIGISIGLVLVVVSEFVGEGGGLGHYILDQQGQFNVPEMYAGILFLGLLGYVLNRVFVLVERRVLAWHYGAAGDPAR
jgi:ABC-type nitrate/sulfonate/bicarbonate transport system permease component